MADYEAAKSREPEFYRTADSLQYGQDGNVPEENIDKMVAELNDRCWPVPSYDDESPRFPQSSLESTITCVSPLPDVRRDRSIAVAVSSETTRMWTRSMTATLISTKRSSVLLANTRRRSRTTLSAGLHYQTIDR